MQRKSSRNDYRTYRFIARSGTPPFDCGDLFAILMLGNASSYGCSRIIWKKREITKERYRRSMNRVAMMTSQSYRVLLKIIYKLALSFFWAIEKKIFDIFSNTEVRLTKDLFGLFELYYLLAYPDNDSSRNNDVFAVLLKHRNYTNSSWISHRM